MAESCIGGYPLSPVASSRAPDHDMPAGRFFVLTIALSLEQGPWVGAAPFIADEPSQSG
jgi:hypothetical protein